MKKLISSTLAVMALSVAANSVVASDYSDSVEDIRLSVTALERQLESMDIDFKNARIESGLNRAQEVKALESRYSELQTQFNNAHYSN